MSRLRWAAVVASGALQWAAFPPLSLGWAIFLAFVPLFWAVFTPKAPGEAPLSFRRCFLLAFTSQVVFFVLLLHWILFLANEELTVPGLMVPALLFMSAYLAVFFGLATGVSATLERLGGPRGFVSLPIFWTLADQLRSLGVLGFPWGSAGYAFAPSPVALQVSAFTGFWGLPFWILSVNALLYAALRAWSEARGRAVALRLAAAVMLVAAPIMYGAAVLSRAPLPGAEDSEGFRLALLQSNTSREIKWKPGYQGVVVEDLLERTRAAAAREPDLIVWPETAAPLLVLWSPDLARSVRETVREVGRHVLVGTLDAVLPSGAPAEHYNAAVLYDPSGVPRQRYYKTRLVPFSEAMPFQDRIPWINALNFGQSDFSSGRLSNLFEVAGKRFSVLICFESIFPEVSRRAVEGGAQYLINTTNDFWFGRSAGPVQHAEMAIHRAVENRTPLARCANTGISFFVDPWGRITDRTGLFVEAMPIAQPAPGSGGSFYTRHGEWLPLSLAALAGLCILLTAGSWARFRARREGEDG